MHHFEQMYLLEDAHYLWEQTLDAEKDGDEFVPTETFVELKNGTYAKARIVRPEPGQAPVLALIVRGCDVVAAEATARAFYEKGYDSMFAMPNGDFGFVSPHVPPRLRPPVQDPGEQ